MHSKDRKRCGQINVFPCDQCGGFHIGRDRRSGYASGTKDWRKDSHKNRLARYIQLVGEDT
jgi:hypothetical protein